MQMPGGAALPGQVRNPFRNPCGNKGHSQRSTEYLERWSPRRGVAARHRCGRRQRPSVATASPEPSRRPRRPSTEAARRLRNTSFERLHPLHAKPTRMRGLVSGLGRGVRGGERTGAGAGVSQNAVKFWTFDPPGVAAACCPGRPPPWRCPEPCADCCPEPCWFG